jgi:DNA-binding PadR family transcriptional regulator
MPRGACAPPGPGMGDIFRDTFLGFVRVHVLYHASKGRIFGVEMIEELREHGYRLSPGTMYPILHALEKAGYLRTDPQVVEGRLRKYYRITPSGRKVLELLRARIGELTREVLEERAPDPKAKPGRR